MHVWDGWSVTEVYINMYIFTQYNDRYSLRPRHVSVHTHSKLLQLAERASRVLHLCF
jgi:hypothetical protein